MSRARKPRAGSAPAVDSRAQLLKLRDRVVLGGSGLRVSPFCLGIVERPEVVTTAYEAGINFFFLTADMHWPLYEPLRRGLRQLLSSSPKVRAKVVVAVVSYVTQPEFSWMPFQEVLQAVPELGYVDVAVIGGSYSADFLIRHHQYRMNRPGGMKALGATFHERTTAVTAVNQDLLDIAFVRYNSSHSGAEVDVFPHIRGDRSARLFNFQSTHGHVDPRRLAELGLPKDKWRPTHTDHYRFALRQPKLDGLLCALDHDEHIADLRRALSKGPLTAAEASYLKQLSALDEGRIALAES